jgi:enamine deaminase RidA (YjgF/YER057c/UK114 family)
MADNLKLHYRIMKNGLLVFVLLAAFSCTSVQEEKKGTAIPETSGEDYDPEAKLRDLGIELSTPSSPVANYVNAVRTGNLIFLAGKGPLQANGENITGRLGADLTIEQGYEAAKITGINQLSVLKAELGNLNKVRRIVKVKGMVNAVPEFTDHPKVINGYSDLMVEVFGEKGKHARAAVGMGSLPGNIAVEIEMIVEVAD